MCLTEIRKGERVSIVAIADADVRTQFIRFGIGEGSFVQCLEKIPLGPVMIRHCRQEIAVGREVAGKIIVSRD